MMKAVLGPVTAIGFAAAMFGHGAPAAAHAKLTAAHGGVKTEIPEPFFTMQAKVSEEPKKVSEKPKKDSEKPEKDSKKPEKDSEESKVFFEEIELTFGYVHKETEDEYEAGVGGSRVFFNRLEIGTEIPYEIRYPNAGSAQRDIGDIEFSAKYQFTEASNTRNILALAGIVALPTGNRAKEIGGTGRWEVSALAGWAFESGSNELGVHVQLGYQQQIRLSNEQKEKAEMLGVRRVRQKELIWRLAVGAPIPNSRLGASAELLGRTIVDAVDRNDEGMIVEFGGGFWWNPLAHADYPGPLSLGVAAKAPLTNRRDAKFSGRFVVKYDFD